MGAPHQSANMSFGAGASASAIIGSMIATMGISKMTHNAIIGAGVQPTTVCSEFEAATVVRNLSKPMESNDSKRMMLNPIRATSQNAETGHATSKYMFQKGDPVCRDAE